MVMQALPQFAALFTTLVSGLAGPGPVTLPGWGHGRRHAVHRSIVVVDIVQSTDPIRRNGDKVVIRRAMYHSLFGAFKWRDLVKCYCEDRGDGALLLVPPSVPKDWLVTTLPERLEAAVAQHNTAMAEQDPARAQATQLRLRVAIHAGEVTFDGHGVVGQAVEYTFRLVEAQPLKAAVAKSRDVCALIVSDWLYNDVVCQHSMAEPERYQHLDCRVKQTAVSAWMRAPLSALSRTDQPRLLQESA